MRVLWLTNDLPPRAGGIEHFVDNLLRRSWPETTVVVGPHHPAGAEHDARQPYEVVRLDGPVLPTPATLRSLREVARAHRPDVVVLGAAWPLGHLATWVRRDPGVPVVALTHGLEAGLAGAGMGWLVRHALRACSVVTVISDHAERALRDHLPPDGAVRLSPGVDPAVFTPDRSAAALRERWGVPASSPLVGCISRLVRRKGQDVLLDAWPVVRRHRPDAWLTLVGSGPLADTLADRVRQLGPDAQVVLTGEVDRPELPAAHAALDVFAMPCRTRWFGTDVEGLGIVYLEAQASGVPVITGRSGGAPETVVEGETGLVVDGRDPLEVAAAIVDLLDDPERRRVMGAAGRRWVTTNWSWETVASRFRDVLVDAVTPPV